MMTVQGIVSDIMRYALHDGPGIRTTVFFKGCPLQCQWCANPESQSPSPEFVFFMNKCLMCNACVDCCEQNAIALDGRGFRQIDRTLCNFCGKCVAQCYAEVLRLVGRTMTEGEVIAEVLKDRDFYRQSGGGVTFSGGEPLRQPVFLEACLEACRRNNLHTVVETAGLTSWNTIKKLLHLVDLFLYDLKVVENASHKAFTGVSNKRILDNLKKLVTCHDVIIRMPMIPGVNDRGNAWQATMAFIKELPWRGQIDLLPYHHLGVGKYAALNRVYALNTSLKSDMKIVRRRRDQLTEAGFSVQLHGG